MAESNIKSIGFNATLPTRIQVENTIDTINKLKDGNDLRQWSQSARKELLLGGNIEITNNNGEIIGEAPKLALAVVSSTFREHLLKKTRCYSYQGLAYIH
jgi:hypothetical protein